MRNKYSLEETVNVLVYNAIADAVYCAVVQLVADSVDRTVRLAVDESVSVPVGNASMGGRVLWEHVYEKTK